VFDHALSGRPVRFHSKDDRRNAQALEDLRTCYLNAGFKDVQFMAEPEAAALASDVRQEGGLCLIVDIGGGTSDFTVFRRKDGKQDILASYGVRVGGTDFDRQLSLQQVMPLFGKGSMIKKEMGTGAFSAPNAIFQELATWEKIPFLYTQQTRRSVAQLQKLAVEPELFARLSSVLSDELGHEVAFAVERAKIRANQGKHEVARIDLKIVAPELSAPLSSEILSETLAQYGSEIQQAATETLSLADVEAAQIEQVVFVGGSSLMSVVDDGMREMFPQAEFLYSEAFTGIIDGLTMATGPHT
jgi:hypothetical chaperone protein